MASLPRRGSEDVDGSGLASTSSSSPQHQHFPSQPPSPSPSSTSASPSPYEYVSYVSLKTVVADAVYHFIRGSLYGAAYGMVTPFFAPGTPGAVAEAKTGIFKPAPLMSQWRSIPSHALLFGSILGVQRFTCKASEFVRGKQDPWNDVAGIGVAIPYYQTFLATHERLVVHNRIVGGAIVLAIMLQQIG